MEAVNPQKPKKSFKLSLIAGASLFLVGAGAGMYIYFSPSSEENSLSGWMRGLFRGEKKSSAAGPGYFHKMDPFLVNLVDPEQLRYLKITIYVESAQEKMNEEYEKKLPQLRDAVLTLLSSKNYKEIMSSKGKESLREEIKERMNQFLTEHKIRNIYFTEFVIQ